MADSNNNILGLQLPTDPRWVNLAAISLEDILADHAFCEQKAATTTISIIQRYAHLTEIVEELSPIVTEEWGHFRMVFNEIKKRGYNLGKQRKDLYVNALLEFVQKGGFWQTKLIDDLMLSAMVEARSCERFRLLSIGLADEKLQKFYYKFMESEAGHYKTFISLAKKFAEPAYVDKRWQEWLNYEATVLANMETRGDRIH